MSVMLRRRAAVIVTALALVLGAVTVLTLAWPRSFRSTALVVIEQRTGGGDAALVLLGQLGRASQIETEIELIQSRHVVERVVDRLDLHAAAESPAAAPASLPGRLAEQARRLLPGVQGAVRPRAVFSYFDVAADAPPGLYHVAARPGGGIAVRDAATGRPIMPARLDMATASLGGPAARPDAPASGTVYRFAGVTLAAPDAASPAVLLRVAPFARAVDAARVRVSAGRRQRDADLIEVRCDGATPEAARELCQAVLDGYMQLRMELRRAEATATARFLREQVDLLGRRLEAAEDSLEAYGARHRVVALGERAAEEVRGFTQLTAQRDQLHAERTALAELIAQIQRGDAGGGTRRYRDLASFPTFLQNPAVTQLLVALVNLENERSALRQRRAETSTEVTALDARIREIELQLLGIGQSYRQALDARVGSLDGALRTAGRRLAAIPEQQVRSARLERQASLLDDLYALLATRLREAEVAEAVNLPNVRVVDQASLPLDSSHPRPRLNLALGSVLGLALGLLLAVYREGTDDSIRERREVERRFGLPVLAMIPRLRGEAAIVPVPALRRPGDPAPRGAARFAVRAGSRNGHRERRSARGRAVEEHRLTLEAFRALATDLRFATRHLNGGAPVIAVTSAVRGEGKSFVACNLALARAAQGARTLLIDADIRGGGARRLFGLPSSGPGLSDVLAATPSVRAEEAVWKGAVSGADLWVIPPGTPRFYSASIFELPKFATLLEHAKLQFDLIVIDTPPINVITDAVPIAAASDAVLVVVRGSCTTRECLELTLERLGRARSYVVGAVLNDVAPSSYHANGYKYARAVEVRPS